MKLPSEASLLRIFIGESDKFDGRPLSEVIVEEAVEFAEASPEPEHDSLFEDIYVEPTPIEYRGYEMAHESEEA